MYLVGEFKKTRAKVSGLKLNVGLLVFIPNEVKLVPGGIFSQPPQNDLTDELEIAPVFLAKNNRLRHLGLPSW
jgi:hypothetical protein